MRKMNVAHNFWQTESGLRLQSIKALLKFLSASFPGNLLFRTWNRGCLPLESYLNDNAKKNPALTTGTAPFKVKVVFKKWKQSLTQLRVTYWIM